MERRGAGPTGWIIAVIVLLMIGSMAATMAISARYDVSGGYIPREQRTPR